MAQARSLLRSGYVWPAAIGIALGSAFAIYLFWSRTAARHADETVADPSLARPAATECAIARTTLVAFHASGADARVRASVAAANITLKAHSDVVNPVNVPGYTDDEADDARSKVKGDWRLCDGLGAFVRGLKWAPMSGDIDEAELALARPGLNKAGDEAKVYEAFSAPAKGVDPEAPRQVRGPWLATLNRGADGVWRVTATSDLSHPSH